MSVYYVRSSGGNDSNTGLSFAQGWATVQKALNIATVGGDIVYICNDGIHYPSSILSTSATTSTAFNYVLIKGASDIGIDDGSRSTISGAMFSNSLLYHNTIGDYFWDNIRFTDSTSTGYVIGSSANQSKTNFKNCRFDNHGVNGFFIAEEIENKVINFVGCEFDNNGSNGFECDFPSYGNDIFIYNCSFHNNTLSGFVHDGSRYMIPMYDCLFYSNGLYGFRSDSTTDSTYFFNCIFDNNYIGIGMGITGGGVGQFNCFNCIFSNNSQYGIYFQNSNYHFSFCDYNCFYNNTAGNINVLGGIPPGSNNLFVNPLYTSITPGSENYVLQSTSPCINTGFGYNG